MTDSARRRRGNVAVPLVTAAVAGTAAAAVGWAAATPPSPPTAPTSPARTSASDRSAAEATTRMERDVAQARRSLMHVHDDVARLLRVHLPRAKVGRVVLVAPAPPPAQVSLPAVAPASVAPAVVAPAAPPPAPPPAHTSTGASGAVH